MREFNVSRETLDNFTNYAELIKKWNAQINLVSKTTLGDIWQRHFTDSAQLTQKLLPIDTNILDVGSGAGFPGLVVAALLKQNNINTEITLVDESTKRCAFLREATRALQVDVKITNDKIESIAPQYFSTIIARAFAPLPKIFSLTNNYAQEGTRYVLLKGEDVQQELANARINWHFKSDIYPSISDKRGIILVITELEQIAKST